MRLIVVSMILLAGLTAWAAEPGNLWQIDTSMEMAGMKMPGRSQQVCAPANAEGPEALAGGDSECKMSNVRRSAGKFSYDVTCPDGSGTGEMVYEGRDAYTSTMTMTSEGRTMTMTTRGKRLGDCDASVVKRQVAAAEAQANAGMAQMCASLVETLMPGNLATYECDAKYKKDLCDRFQTPAGFSTVAARPSTGQAALDAGTLPEVARFCSVDADALRARLCGDANRGGELDFLGANCPAEARAIAQRECAGRSFTSPPAAEYREFCGSYARAMMQDGSESSGTPQAAPSPQGEAVKEGARRLKGLLGF